LQRTQLRDFQNRNRKPVLTFPESENPVLQKEHGFGIPSKINGNRLLTARLAVIFLATGHHRPWPVPNYTAW